MAKFGRKARRIKRKRKRLKLSKLETARCAWCGEQIPVSLLPDHPYMPETPIPFQGRWIHFYPWIADNLDMKLAWFFCDQECSDWFNKNLEEITGILKAGAPTLFEGGNSSWDHISG